MKKILLIGLVFIFMISFVSADYCTWVNNTNTEISDDFNRGNSADLDNDLQGNVYTEGAGDSIVSNRWSFDSPAQASYTTNALDCSAGCYMQFNATLASVNSGFRMSGLVGGGGADYLIDYDNTLEGKIGTCKGDAMSTNSFNGDYVIKAYWESGADVNSVEIYQTDGTLIENITCTTANSYRRDYMVRPYAYSGGNNFDDLMIWEKQNGVCPLAGAIKIPTFVDPTPSSGAYNNTFIDVVINVTSYSDNINVTFGGIQVGNGSESSPFVFELNSSLVPTVGVYTYYACNDLGCSDNRTWIYELSKPTIIINPSTTFKTDNTSELYNTHTNLTINITLEDNLDLNYVSINITTGSTNKYSFGNDSINETLDNLIKNIDISTWDTGEYNVEFYITDEANNNLTDNYKFNISSLVLNSVGILPSTVVDLQDINGYANATEGQGKDVVYDYIWFKNGVLFRSNTTTNYTSDANSLLDTIDDSLTSLGDNWTLSSRSFIGSIYTDWLNSTTVTVINFAVDNCTDYNTTALTFNFLDLTSNPAYINLSSSIEYWYSTSSHFNYTIIQNNISSISYCISPEDIDLDSILTIQYFDNGDLYNFYSTDTRLNLNETIINLFVDSGVSPIQATVYDNQNKRVEGAFIHVERYDFATGNYLPVTQGKTDFQGETILNLVKDTVYYRFLIYYPSTTLVKTTTPTYINENNIIFQINLYEDIAQNFFNVYGIDYSLTFNDATNNFKLIFDAPTANINQGCLKVYKIGTYKNTLYNESCIASTGGTILINVINDSNYVGKAYVYTPTESLIDSLNKYFDESNVAGLMGVLVILIMTVVMGFLIKVNLPLTVIMIPIPTIFGAYMNLINVSMGMAISVELAAFVLAYFINRNG